MNRSLCRGEPMEKWSPRYLDSIDRHNPKLAKAHREFETLRARLQCAGCPVKVECGTHAVLTMAESVIQGGYLLPDSSGNRKHLARVRKQMRADLGLEDIAGCRSCHRRVRAVGVSSNGIRPLCDDCKDKAERSKLERSLMEKEMKILVKRRKEMGALRANDYRKTEFGYKS